MRLNGSEFKIYLTDTDKSIEKRIAASLHSLPKWLIYQDGKPTTFSDNDDLIVVDFLTDALLNQTTLTIPKLQDGDREIQDLFIASNKTLNQESLQHRRILFHTLDETGLYKDADKIFNDKDLILQKLRKEINQNIDSVNQHLQLAQSLDKIHPVFSLPYELDRTQFSFELSSDDDDTSLEQLFDSLITSKYIPYSVLSIKDKKSVYKIYNKLHIEPSWVNIKLDDVLFLKVDSEKDDLKPLTAKYKRYTNAAFTILDFKLLITMDTFIGSRFITKEQFVNRILSSFNKKLSIVKSFDNLVVVYYTIPRQCFDSAIFSEMVMNDDIFNNYVAIDEFNKPSKATNSIYLHRLDLQDTISMSLKYTTKHNQYGLTNIGEPYIKCRLKSNSIEGVEIFKNIIGKLFSIYNDKYDDIVEYYKKNISGFNPIKCKKKTVAPTGLRGIAPEVFAPNYTRKCAHPPIIIKENNTDFVNQTMKFPIHNEIVNGEIVPTNIYGCPTDRHRFIGLKSNELENKSTFPYVPCCFARDQINKSGSLYRKYFYDETETRRTRQQQETSALIRRILNPGDTEILPENISKLFNILESDPTVSYVRMGVSRSKYSAIEAILLGLGQIGYKRQRQTTIQNTVNRSVAKLIDEKYAMASKQELYDYSIKDILHMMTTSDIRPSKFIHALELAFDVNLFIFESSNNNIGGSLLIPPHAQMYLRFKPNRETLFLFQHYGTVDPENIEYPQNELIIRNTGSFLPGDSIVKGVYSIFTRMTKSYVNSTINTSIRPLRLPIDSQTIDLYGKCRVLNILDDNDVLSLIIDPIPPFAVLACKKYYRVSLEVVVRFVNRWAAKILWQRVVETKTVEIGINIGIDAVVIVDSQSQIPNVVVKTDKEQFNIQNVQSLSTFTTTSKTASILLQYTFWLLSKFINGLVLTKNNVDDVLLNFIQNSTSLRASHEYYPDESDKFQDPSSFVQGSILIVTSNDVIRRLLFICRLKAITSPVELASYAFKIKIPNYYDTIQDFKSYNNSFILNGEDAVNNLIKTYGIEFTIYNSIKPEYTKLYFFKNDILSKTSVFIAQPTDSLLNANAIVSSWTRLGYNIASESDQLENTSIQKLSADVYSYVNESEITLISKSTALFSGCILGYKVENEPIFIALLKLF